MLEPPTEDNAETLDRLASFLKDVDLAWKAAEYEQRNRLARCLFEEIWVRDKKVVAVKPREEFEPFFRLNLEGNGSVNKNIELATPTGFEPAISALTGQYVKTTTPRGRGYQRGLGSNQILACRTQMVNRFSSGLPA